MSGFVRFAILGLGAGAVYGLAALGAVLVYRGSGVINFAQGAFGMVGAFVFYDARDEGTSAVAALAMALGIGAALGAFTHVAVMRPLRRAPAISRLIATLGLLAVVLGLADSRWGGQARIAPKLFATDTVTLWGDVTIGRDRLVLLGIGVALTALLTVAYRVTRFGLSTTAVAESRRATAAQGISPDVVATVNWALGGALAVLAAILIVNLTGLDTIGLSLLIVPALAAALVGGFRSFPLTLLGGLLIGVLESEIAYVQVHWDITLSGWARSVPFLVIVIVLVVRGRALPLRGEGIEQPPEIGTGRIRPTLVIPAVAGAAVLIATVLSTTLVETLTTTLALAIILLSIVVVTGYAGQLSLAQVALAGMGAWFAARAIVTWGVSFEVAFVIGVLGAIPVGLAVGLPALRVRGVNLTVATLGLALVIESLVLANLERTGGPGGTDVGRLRLFGVAFDGIDHPQRYAFLALALFVVCAVLVANLRRGRAGRRLVAVRSNERAAAALGINVLGAKLYAFGFAASLAAVGGILIGFRRPNVTFFPTFSVFQSLFVVIYAVLGGIGFVIGAIIGAAVAPGNFMPSLVGGAFDNEQTVQVVLGFLVLVGLLVIPNGVASVAARFPLSKLRPRFARRPRSIEPLPPPVKTQVTPATLHARDLSVRFGGVAAVDGVSLDVSPGEVVGLIGPNGAGKTTIVDALTGFVSCNRGEIELGGTQIGSWSARRRARGGISRSFQSLELFETMTVRENLRTASDRRDPRAYLTDLVAPGRSPLAPGAIAAIHEFELEDALDRLPDELPYGRRRLVAIARAVATGPSVLLLDEPAAGLDERESAELGQLVRRLADEWGMGILLIEHDVSLVLRTCDRVVVLDYGRKLAEGTPTEIRANEQVITAYLGVADEPESTTQVAVRAEPGDTPAEGTAADDEPADDTPTGGRRPGADEPALLRARGLSAGYGDLAVVRDLDLEVHPGEVVALLGPNGAGKTTTLLTLVGELNPLGGTLECLGNSNRSPLHRRIRRGLGFVPEERSVIMSLSIGANLRLGRGERRAALALFPELEPLLTRRAGLCSGGEQQMLTLARALAAEPRLLIVDELSLGLAPQIVRRLLRTIREAADRGVGVLIVEQRAREALGYADRVYVLQRGQLVLEGTQAEVAGTYEGLEHAYLSEVTPS